MILLVNGKALGTVVEKPVQPGLNPTIQLLAYTIKHVFLQICSGSITFIFNFDTGPLSLNHIYSYLLFQILSSHVCS